MASAEIAKRIVKRLHYQQESDIVCMHSGLTKRQQLFVIFDSSLRKRERDRRAIDWLQSPVAKYLLYPVL